MIPAIVMSGLLLLPAMAADGPSGRAAEGPTVAEEAYAHNRDGMIAMSKARLEDAIDEFQKAAALVPDYGIIRRGLRYTPNFMTAWAYEKLGLHNEACRYFQRFLELAPVQSMEEEKTEHAHLFLDHHCPSVPRRSLPDEEYGL